MPVPLRQRTRNPQKQIGCSNHFFMYNHYLLCIDTVLSRAKHNGGTMQHQAVVYYETIRIYFTKRYIATHTIYVNLKQLYFLVS